MLNPIEVLYFVWY